MVQFPNDPCPTTAVRNTMNIMGNADPNNANLRMGTCYTSAECTDRGGTSSGNCAVGFGICCLFTAETCDTTITENCTYVRNPGFPAGYNDFAICNYNIQKSQEDICSLRLDFETFQIIGPNLSTENNNYACRDTMNIQGLNNGLGNIFPQICGTNTGQHSMFFEDCCFNTTASIY